MRVLDRDPIAGVHVTLRQLTPADAEGVVEACNDAQTRRFLQLLPDPYTTDDALEWITRSVPRAWDAGEAHFAIVLDGSDRIAGSIGIGDPRLGGHATTIGYWVAPWARGRGVATDALRTLAAWTLRQGFGRIELRTDMTNAASQRVAVAAGFIHEGVRRSVSRSADGTWRDAVVWTRLASDPGIPVPRALPDLPRGELSDGVITLSPVTEADAEDVYQLVTLPEVIATTVAPHPPTRESVAKRCGAVSYRWLIGERAECLIRDGATGSFAGDISLFREGPTGQALVGYSLVRQWRGRGYATRAVRLIADWAFDIAGVPRLAAGTAPDNIGSQRTLEHAGFTREGYERSRLPGQRGSRIDNVGWAMLPGDRIDAQHPPTPDGSERRPRGAAATQPPGR